MKLEFGVKVKVGNYYILKYAKGLGKKELSRLRNASGIPRKVQKHLDNGSTLPFIKVGTISGSWSVEYIMGTSMYDAIDALRVVMDETGERQLYGVEAKNAEAMFVAMFADTTVVGDYEYQVAKQKLLSEYLDRASKKLNKKADAGKSEEELRKESEAAVEETAARETHAKTLLDMAEEIVRKEAEDEQQH